RAEGFARSNFDAKTGSFSASGSAGVPLYAAGATIGSIQSSIDSINQEKPQLEKTANDKRASKEERDKANAQLDHLKDVQHGQDQALESVTKRLNDQGFVQGFGCNGGEEFLSYLQISQTLLANHSKDWSDWDKKITSNIDHVQNKDGSWMGHHC